MKIKLFCFAFISLFMTQCAVVKFVKAPVSSAGYLDSVKAQLKIQWPANRTINLVFHGHSVPSGYAKTPEVRTFDSYSYQLLALLKQKYPYAVINIIITARGGENSISGAERFKRDMLIHKADVAFVDYALNQLNICRQKNIRAWDGMIKEATRRNIKVILLTPSPDLRVSFSDNNNALKINSDQIIRLANENHVGLVNSFGLFNTLYTKGDSLKNYMAQVNHPNKKGNEVAANEFF